MRRPRPLHRPVPEPEEPEAEPAEEEEKPEAPEGGRLDQAAIDAMLEETELSSDAQLLNPAPERATGRIRRSSKHQARWTRVHRCTAC